MLKKSNQKYIFQHIIYVKILYVKGRILAVIYNQQTDNSKNLMNFQNEKVERSNRILTKRLPRGCFTFFFIVPEFVYEQIYLP